MSSHTWIQEISLAPDFWHHFPPAPLLALTQYTEMHFSVEHGDDMIFFQINNYHISLFGEIPHHLPAESKLSRPYYIVMWPVVSFQI